VGKLRDKAFLDLAAEEALYSEVRFRMGCFVVSADESRGARRHNSRHQHPQLARWGFPTYSGIHAEVAALLALGEGWGKRGRVYVVRLARNGDWALAKPCAYCMGALVACGIARVVWTTGPGEWDSINLF
jgi:tRNA(Arg) A34 adenosine deaminase TadA